MTTTTTATDTMDTMTTTTAERYDDLSHRRAREGDVRRALLAAWAGDVHVLEELLWENGLGEAPDPYAQLATIGESVAAAIEAIAADAPADLTPREVVELARHAMVTTFDASVHDLLHERLADLGHLDAPDAPGAPDGTAADEAAGAPDRLAGRTPETLVADLRATAADCMAVAQLMAGEGEPTAALRMARQSDAAAFEAYLVDAAIGAGDTGLVTVDLRWQLAVEAEEQLERAASGEPGMDELRARRDVLSSVVGSAERRVLDNLLEQW